MSDKDIFLENTFSYIEEERLIDEGDRILVGVSGGADSVALLRSLRMLRERLCLNEKDCLVVAHINHMIRGEEAEEDRRFVEELCSRLGVKCVSLKKDIPMYARELSITVEEAGRKFRYECFERLADQEGLDKIAVAHNKNDLVETVLFNMARGSGLKGISGIPARRGRIIRPLLFANRRDIEAYLEDIRQAYRTDSTNLSTDYDRNKLRHVVIPALTEINKNAVSHIAELALEAKRSDEAVRKRALKGIDYDRCFDEKEGRLTLMVDDILKLDRQEMYYLIYEAVARVAGSKKDITRKNIDAVAGLMFQNTGKRVELPYGIVAVRSYDKLKICRGEKEKKEYEFFIDSDGCYDISENEILKIHTEDVSTLKKMGKNTYTKVVDYDKIKGKLCVRTFKEGDYITINENGDTKKISRLFIDKKIDREKRGMWPLVACGSEVVWAVGLRYNEAYRIDGTTKRVVVMEYERKGDLNG